VTATTNCDVYNYPRRLEKNTEAIAKMRNGLVALNFLDHLLVQYTCAPNQSLWLLNADKSLPFLEKEKGIAYGRLW